MNSHLGELGITFFGLHPGTTRAQVAERLAQFAAGGDNRITELSRGYRIRLGTGWDVPAGVLHAPASVCTYEPQRASDVACMCESWSNNREVMSELLWKDVPADRVGDVDYIVELLDWERNVDPDFWTRNMMVPVETRASAAVRRRLDRALGRLPRRGVQRQGAHGPAGQRRSPSATPMPTAASSSRASARMNGRTISSPDADPLWPVDRGRALRVRVGRPARA